MANVTRERKRAAVELRRGLSDAYITVLGPDHPFLLMGPDILVGGEGKLTAIYVPSAAERQGDQDQLRTRYVLSRLALPQHARHLMVWDGGWDEVVAPDLAGSFADILSHNHIADLSKIAKDGNFIGKQRPIAGQELAGVRDRFSKALYATRLANRAANQKRGRSGSARVDQRGGRRTPRQIDVTRTSDAVATHYFDYGVATKEFVHSLLVSTVPERQPIVEGKPRLVGHPFDIARLHDLQSTRGDPLKVRRAAAFAGWVLLDEHESELSESIADRLSRA